MPSPSSARGFGSAIVTWAPFATANRAMPAVARPLPRPMIVTRRPRKSCGETSGSKMRLMSAAAR